MDLMWLWVALALVVLVVIIVLIVGIAARRSLRSASERADAAWDEVRSEMRRRGELVPALVERVRGIAGGDAQPIAEVERARAATLEASGPAEASAAEGGLQTALRALYADVEGYPRLQSDRDFLALRAELTQAENRIQAARRFYNGSARELNTKTKVFPTSLVAGSAGISERDFFEAADRAAIAEPPRVQF